MKRIKRGTFGKRRHNRTVTQILMEQGPAPKRNPKQEYKKVSAYLCNPEHVAALAAFAAHTKCGLYEWSNVDDVARTISNRLAQANIVSIQARYPDCPEGHRPGPIGYPTDKAYIAACEDYARRYTLRAPTLSELDIWNMAACFAYQSCEVKGWAESSAKKQIEWIQDMAVRMFPGFDRAVRNFEEAQP